MKNYSTKVNIFEKEKTLFERVFDFIFGLVIWVSLTILAFAFLYIDVTVVGASMEPTIFSGATAYINKLERPQRQDIVVLNLEEDVFIIKRLIAIGGDTVTIEENDITGQVEIFITGNKLQEDYILNKSILQTTLSNFNGLKSHEYWQDYFVDNTLTIPAGYIFYLGDNRLVSQDSSSLGPQPKEKLVGKVTIIVPENKTFLEYMWQNFLDIF